jgi:hypothetical protein
MANSTAQILAKARAYFSQLSDTEARLNAALAECARLRDENEKLRQLARPPVQFVGGGDEGGEVKYFQSDGGW